MALRRGATLQMKKALKMEGPEGDEKKDRWDGDNFFMLR